MREKDLAEREGFEPPIPVKVWLISSQLHSTGLCHLSVIEPVGIAPKDSLTEFPGSSQSRQLLIVLSDTRVFDGFCTKSQLDQV